MKQTRVRADCYKERKVSKEQLEGFLKLLNPIAPHITEELNKEVLNNNESLTYQKWPEVDESKLVEDTITIVVQVNGKIRDKLFVSSQASKAEVEQAALASEKVQAFLNGNAPKKVIVVPSKLVNIVM